MFNIFKKKKKEEAPLPEPKIGSYRIKSKGDFHVVQRYQIIDSTYVAYGGVFPRFSWVDIFHPFKTLDEAKAAIKSKIERDNQPTIYTKIDVEKLGPKEESENTAINNVLYEFQKKKLATKYKVEDFEKTYYRGVSINMVDDLHIMKTMYKDLVDHFEKGHRTGIEITENV